MRRMATNKQLEYVNDLSQITTLENNNDTISIRNNNVLLKAINNNVSVASVVLDGEGNVELSADGEYYMYGHYSDDAGDYVYCFLISEEGIQLQTLDENSGDYISKITINGNGNIVLDIPTSDPEVEGALWNDSGVLKISAGA